MKTTLLSTSPTGIALYELSNDASMRVQVMNYGARLFGIWVPTLSGDVINVLAGFATPDEFRGVNPYFNATIGRMANRLSDAQFTLDGVTYRLSVNEIGRHHLHGGVTGFDRRMWEVVSAADGAITMQYISPDGEEGYPGTLTVYVTYRLGDDNSLALEYEATTTLPTPVNMTNHSYFNLDGDFRSILRHRVRIDSDVVALTDDEFVSRGDMLNVEGTMYDFRRMREVGEFLRPLVPHVVGRGGYDLSYVLTAHDDSTAVATAVAEHSGVRMDVYTDRPCLQFYTGNFLDGSVVGRHTYQYQSAFCMEAQDYSNAPNVPAFPSNILRPGERYTSRTVYRFGLERR